MGIEALVVGGIIASAAGAAANASATRDASEANRRNVEATNRLNEHLTREQWQREDVSVQRRAADLKAAGISPNLAAGSAASTSPAARMEAPQEVPSSPGGDFAKALGGGAMNAIAMDTARAQANLTRTQVNTEIQKQKNLSANAVNQLANAGFKSEASRIMKKDADLWVKRGIDVRDRDAVSKVTKALPQTTEKVRNFVDNPPKSWDEYKKRYQDAYRGR